MVDDSFDLAVVGAGIVGLAHALTAARLGKRVVVIDRDAQANGASVRNFGFVTVTGQEQGPVWRRARRSRDVWEQIAGPAGIPIVQRGLLMVARRPEARVVLEAFLDTDMAAGCRWIPGDQIEPRFGIRPAGAEGALESEIDLRVESRTAIPALARYLEEALGVTFRRGVTVHGVDTRVLETSTGAIYAEAIVVCPGDNLTDLFPESFANVTRCKLQMLRLASPGYRLPSAVMSDLGLVRYLGYAALPQAAALKARLEAEQPDHLANGIHLIVAQSSDGSLIVGDSHHYAATPDPFASEEVDRLILDEFAHVFGHAPPPVVERWTGTYASAAGHNLTVTPMRNVRLVTVTGGTGASTSFGLAEEVIGDLYGIQLGVNA